MRRTTPGSSISAITCIGPLQLGHASEPDALIMHPGPVNRGVEIDSEIADSGRSVILEQVTNGLAVRMAVLFLVNGRKGPQEVAAN